MILAVLSYPYDTVQLSRRRAGNVSLIYAFT